jgi:hypothetical protein
VDCLKAKNKWAGISGSDNTIALLRQIRTSMYTGATGATSKHSVHSLIEAQNKFFAFCQSVCMTNAKYLHTFNKSLVDAIDHLSGNIVGTDQAIIAERIIADEGNVDDPATWEAMKIRVHEEYLAICFFLQSNPKCFGALIANAQNDFVGGVNK